MFDRIRSFWSRSARDRSARAAARRAEPAVTVRTFRSPVRRWALAAWLSARRAVRSGVSLPAFLRARLDLYMRRAPSFQHPLPETFTVADDGTLVVAPSGAVDVRAGVLADPGGVAGPARTPDEIRVAMLRAQREAEAQAIGERVDSLDQDQRRLEAQLQEASADAEDLRLRLRAGVDDGSMAPEDLAPMRALRPGVVGPWAWLGAVACVAGLALVEAAAFAPGYLDQVGVDVSRLDFAWAQNRLGLVGGLLVAGGATAATFWLYARTLRAIRTAVAGWSAAPRQRPVLVLRAIGAACGAALILAVSIGMALVRHATGEASTGLAGALGDGVAAPALSPWLFMALTIAVPVAAALLHEHASKLARARRLQLAERSRFDRRLAERVTARRRAEELLLAAETRRDELMELVAAAREARLAFADEVQAEEDHLRRSIEAERQFAVAFCNGVKAALAADRLAYLAARARFGGGRSSGGPRVAAEAAAVVAACLALAAATGCATPSEALMRPLHQSLVISGDPADPAAGDERRRAFERWIAEAVDRPGSTFCEWDVAGGAVVPGVRVDVPGRWSAPVMGSKRAFVERARRMLDDREAIASAPAPRQGDGGEERVLFCCAGCGAGTASWVATDADQPLHEAVLCDLSGSALEGTCDDAGILAARDRWLQDSRAVAGSSFLVLLVARTRDRVAVLHDETVPAGGAGERLALAVAARGAVPPVTAPASTAGSALAEAIDVAADELGHRAGRRRLVVLSDGRQVTPGQWDFERGVPEPAAFVEWMRRNELASDLAGFDVTLSGLHHASSPGRGGFSAVAAARLERLWDESLRALGATDVRLTGRRGPIGS